MVVFWTSNHEETHRGAFPGFPTTNQRLSSQFPAKPRCVGRRVSFRRVRQLLRRFLAKPRQVRRRVRSNLLWRSVFASCVALRRRSTDLESRHTIPTSRHFRIGIFESSWSFALNKRLSSPFRCRPARDHPVVPRTSGSGRVMFDQSRRLFGLPLSAKMELLRNKNYRGYTPSLDEHLDHENQVHGDYKEGYYIGVELQEDDPEAKKPFYGPNVWPAPDVLPGWRETMEEYHRQCLEMAKSVGRLVALALDLDIHFFDKPEMLGEAIATLRLLHCDGHVSDPANGIFGAGAHSDFGFITLLATDDVAGLQICKDKDAKPQIWEYIPPIKGAFVVNVGDMLERWSNGIFKSTLHRVVGNGQDRYFVLVSSFQHKFDRSRFNYRITFLPIFMAKYKVPWIMKWNYEVETGELNRIRSVKWWDKFNHQKTIS